MESWHLCIRKPGVTGPQSKSVAIHMPFTWEIFSSNNQPIKKKKNLTVKIYDNHPHQTCSVFNRNHLRLMRHLLDQVQVLQRLALIAHPVSDPKKAGLALAPLLV